MKLELTTAATEEPVTPADVKTRSRTSTSSEDGLLSDFIVAARQAAEAATWHQLATIDLRQGDYAAAREKFETVLDIRQSVGDRADVMIG
ncbi:hypothetical protein LCGC14_2827840, partial [marine sediment metagenome]